MKRIAESIKNGVECVSRAPQGKLIHCITCDIRFPGAESGLAHECPRCGGTIWRDVETWRRLGKHAPTNPPSDIKEINEINETMLRETGMPIRYVLAQDDAPLARQIARQIAESIRTKLGITATVTPTEGEDEAADAPHIVS